MRRFGPLSRLLCGAAFSAALSAPIAPSGAAAQSPSVIFANQGVKWSDASRAAFYAGDQGSQMIPLAWMKALKQADGKPFMDDSLSRYGYLPNTFSNNPEHLPVGFTAATPADASQQPQLGMTCAACHTRQITAQGQTLRIDGGPAIVDFQSLLADLDQAVLGVLASDGAFQAFAQAVLGTSTPDPSAVLLLRADVTVWSTRFHVLMTKALPTDHPWGPSRLDAVSMIYNRLTGLDIGVKPTYLIPGNIRLADAPARYPFLWNAPVQSMTQWPGFAQNGSDLLGLARNLGEVYGVFATFHPQKPSFPFAPINREYDKENSANYAGLGHMERLIAKIGPPKWPWSHDEALAKKGEAVFNRTDDQGCVGCHGQTPGPIRFGTDPIINQTWATPLVDVGTDTHEWDVLYRTADSGSLENAYIPLLTSPLCKTDTAFNILATSVLGGIIQHYAPLLQTAAPQFDVSSPQLSGKPLVAGQGLQANLSLPQLPPLQQMQGVDLRLTSLGTQQLQDLRGAFASLAAPPCTAPPATNVYESRVLYGIWAAAPYLHNGSVPTLAELLKPPSQRVKSFKIGPAYDTVNVGVAAEQTTFDYTLVTTDCDHLSSGNSNCGHPYGTKLSDGDKAALIEYLKVLMPPGSN